jgi:hypothetical protein
MAVHPCVVRLNLHSLRLVSVVYSVPINDTCVFYISHRMMCCFGCVPRATLPSHFAPFCEVFCARFPNHVLCIPQSVLSPFAVAYDIMLYIPVSEIVHCANHTTCRMPESAEFGRTAHVSPCLEVDVLEIAVQHGAAR